MKEVLRYRQRYSGTVLRPRGVGHHVVTERFNKGNPRVFTPGVPVDAEFVFSSGLDRDPQSINSDRVAGLVKPNARDADARIITLCNESWKQIEAPIRTANRSRI